MENRRYKVLVADDSARRHSAFGVSVAIRLKQEGIVFDPLHYCFELKAGKFPERLAVYDYLENAKAESAPYDIVISDLSFKGDDSGYGRGGIRTEPNSS